MSTDRFISFDLACENCSYNLRGLPVGSRCPECGRDAPPGVSTHLEWNLWLHEASWGNVARAIGYRLEAVVFVLDAMEIAQKENSPAQIWGRAHIRADDICRAFRQHAMAYFPTPIEAVELLRAWGIRRSEDVGNIIYGLVACGRLATTAGDFREDFNNQFTLADLLTGSP